MTKCLVIFLLLGLFLLSVNNFHTGTFTPNNTTFVIDNSTQLYYCGKIGFLNVVGSIKNATTTWKDIEVGTISPACAGTYFFGVSIANNSEISHIQINYDKVLFRSMDKTYPSGFIIRGQIVYVFN